MSVLVENDHDLLLWEKEGPCHVVLRISATETFPKCKETQSVLRKEN